MIHAQGHQQAAVTGVRAGDVVQHGAQLVVGGQTTDGLLQIGQSRLRPVLRKAQHGAQDGLGVLEHLAQPLLVQRLGQQTELGAISHAREDLQPRQRHHGLRLVAAVLVAAMRRIDRDPGGLLALEPLPGLRDRGWTWIDSGASIARILSRKGKDPSSATT